MSDDKNSRGTADRQRIDLEDPDEVRSWASSLSVTDNQLIEAVRIAGIEAARVREYLDKTQDRS